MADVLDPPVNEHGEITDNTQEGTELATVDPKTAKVKARTKPLTEREERQLYTLFATAEHAERLILLEAFEGKAHLVAGFESFEDYCRGRLGLTYDKSYLSRLVKAAKFERQITGRSFNSLKLGEQIDEKEVKKLPSLKTVMEITRVPDEKKWVLVFDEYNGYRLSNDADKKPPTPDQQVAELKKIVGREIKAADPDAKRPGRKPGEGRAKAAPIEAEVIFKDTTGSNNGASNKAGPVTGATYDGSPEQEAIENGSMTYLEATERLSRADSFISTFVSLMSSDELNVQALNELFNDCTQYQGQYGL